MELTPKQQIAELIKTKKRILILTHKNPDGDAVGSILALYLVLSKLGKEATIICPDLAPTAFSFLPAIDKLKTVLDGAKDFVITLDYSSVPVERLAYKNHPEGNKLNIIVTPKKGSYSPEDLSFSYGLVKYDLVFVLDSSDLDRLGGIYEENPEIFYESPVINIDHHVSNDYFGKINLVDITATSTAEILVALLESLGREKNLLDEDVATCLLAGIVTDTGSFQNQNTTPKSFTVAAQLVAAGARQQEIIKHIYKTKRLSTLKLWGKILTNIVYDQGGRFVWSNATKADFVECEAGEDESSGVIDELLKSVPGADFALLLTERGDGVHGSLRSGGQAFSVEPIARIFNGGGHEQAAAFFLSGTTIQQSQEIVINKIKNFPVANRQSTDREPDHSGKPNLGHSAPEMSEISEQEGFRSSEANNI